MSGIPAGAGQLLGKRLGKYEILALLALGGTAEIYLARIDGAAGFEKYVVVKCLHDHLADDTEFVKMFLDEARLAAHLDHSNIVQTMELGQHEGRYYMVMEFLAGLSLAMIVRRAAERLPNGKIPVPLVLNMLAQACAGLHYAHEKAMNGKPLNIVHRDISPQNLVISFEGVVKVVDFGIAKAELRETRTRSGTIKGKFAYMSPEQCVANNVDRRTDVFALGVIGHELLTGHRLFKRPSPYETYQAVMECDVKPPSQIDVEIDPALDAILMKAITKTKEDRYPSAEAFGDALLGYLHHRGKGSGHGDVSRFFDEFFAQELEEHSARMRELISGRDVSVDTGVSWGDEDEAEKRANETVDIVSGRASQRSIELGTSDLEIGEGIRNDDDELPPEKTRIETNPLERINELDAMAARASKPAKPATGPAKLVAPGKPATGPAKVVGPIKMPPSGPLPLPAPPTGPVQTTPPPQVASGRFPDLANLPTMIADPDDPDPDQGETVLEKPELAKTMLGAQPLDAAVVAAANAPRRSSPTPARPHPSSSAPPPQGPVAPGGYPMVNRELSAQIAAGATVFPSDMRPSGPMPPAARVSDSGPAPIHPPVQRTPDGGNPALGDPQRAANVMSPVGQQYPEQVDWAVAAAAPARAVPPWMLAALFVAALGLALTITIVIAKIIR